MPLSTASLSGALPINMEPIDRSAVVLLSGGQDSTTCFHYARRKYEKGIYAVLFDYGQRHRVELELAADTARQYGVEWRILPVEALGQMGLASLTNDGIANTPGGAAAADGWHAQHNLPPSFVPGRNALFFSLAASLAVPLGYDAIVTGVCGTDHAGYPDCREGFVSSMQEALRHGLDSPDFRIDAPLLKFTKAQTWALADALGILGRIVTGTHTCYEGQRDNLHDWGYGCGQCGACVERANGYAEWLGTVELNG
jgi:7-cyano-7-deazaguanine synthase